MKKLFHYGTTCQESVPMKRKDFFRFLFFLPENIKSSLLPQKRGVRIPIPYIE
ncbi:MAG: hypothetical protein LUG18_15620 [Candidatus Azobacteroides sp.]|nr:hypothetical protein [Candidatus Azobacteroides sp.]